MAITLSQYLQNLWDAGYDTQGNSYIIISFYGGEPLFCGLFRFYYFCKIFMSLMTACTISHRFLSESCLALPRLLVAFRQTPLSLVAVADGYCALRFRGNALDADKVFAPIGRDVVFQGRFD